MEIPNPAGRSVPGRCQPSQPTRRTAEPASSPGTRRTISFINVASAASLAEGELQSTLQDCGRAEVGLVSPRKCGCLRVPTASPRKGLVQQLPRDCGARAGRTASVPCPLSPVPVPQPTPSPQQPSPPRPAPSKPHCKKRSAVRGGGTRGLHAENTLGLLPGVPATARIGTPACRAALVPWEAPSPEHAMPWDPPPVLQPPSSDAGARPFYLCRPSLSSTGSSPGKLSSGSSRVSASAGRQRRRWRDCSWRLLGCFSSPLYPPVPA